MARTEHRNGIVAFLLLAFGLAWLPFFPVLVGGSGIPILMPFAPAIACFVVRKWITREGFTDAGLRLNVRKWPLYLVALFWPFGVLLLRAPMALLLHVAPSGFRVPWGLAAHSPSARDLLIWSLSSLILAPLIFGEEFGWRGYLQVRLHSDQPLLAAVATGLIWGVWHYPLILSGGGSMQSRLVMLLVFPVATVVFSIFLGWLRLRSGSVWAGAVAHAANNGIEDNFNRLTFTGRVDGVPSTVSTAPSILSEAVILLGIVAFDGVRRWRRGIGLPSNAAMISRDQAA